MKLDFSFLRRPKPPDRYAEELAGIGATLSELTEAVTKVTKSHFQLASLVESQAETLEEALGNIEESLAGRRRLDEEREKEELVEQSLGSLAKEFLPVLDGLERIGHFLAQNQEITTLSCGPPLIEALRAVADRSRQALAALGVSRVPALGRPFDPHLHHAIKTVATDDPEMDGRVVEEVVSGYQAGSRVLRYPSVVVAVKDKN